jgi:histidine triad (HIT) family protein
VSESRCIFCSIIAGHIRAYTVFEDAHAVGFLDHRPLLPGHVLVVPKAHYETLGDLPADLVGPFFQCVQRLAGAVERGLRADGSFVAVNIRISQSVPHLHVHVVPRRHGDGLFGKTFQWIRRPYPNEDAVRQAQTAIIQAISPHPSPIS